VPRASHSPFEPLAASRASVAAAFTAGPLLLAVFSRAADRRSGLRDARADSPITCTFFLNSFLAPFTFLSYANFAEMLAHAKTRSWLGAARTSVRRKPASLPPAPGSTALCLTQEFAVSTYVLPLITYHFRAQNPAIPASRQRISNRRARRLEMHVSPFRLNKTRDSNRLITTLFSSGFPRPSPLATCP
jgi:hypothetical protein